MILSGLSEFNKSKQLISNQQRKKISESSYLLQILLRIPNSQTYPNHSCKLLVIISSVS